MAPESSAPRCASAISTELKTAAAVEEVCAKVQSQLGAPVSLACLFVSHQHAAALPAVAPRLVELLGTRNILGCTGESIVGTGQEIEGQAALSLWVAHLPGTQIETMQLNFQQTGEGGSFLGWPDALLGDWPAGSVLLALGEPFSFPADALLERLNEDRPGVPVSGGMASGGFSPGENRLLLGDEVYESGAVVARLSGNVRVRTVVSQGCRPIGQPLVVTKAEQNVIFGLGGQPALEKLGEIYAELPARDQLLIRSGLHLGRVTSEYQESFQRGDFLIRNVIAVDGAAQAVAVGDYFRVGQTVQFHLRDEQSADEDLQELLAQAATESAPVGGLLFTCNGRGTRLFSEQHHDAAAIDRQFPGLPLSGFFAQGEIGPVGPQNFLHGFTASILLIETGD